MFSVTIYFGPFVSILVSCITLTGNTLPILTMSCCRNSASSRRKEREGAASTRDLKISFLSFAYWSTSLFNLIKSSFTFCCCAANRVNHSGLVCAAVFFGDLRHFIGDSIVLLSCRRNSTSSRRKEREGATSSEHPQVISKSHLCPSPLAALPCLT